MLLVKIKDLHAVINNKPLFDEPVKKSNQGMKNLLRCQKMMVL